MVTLSGNPGYQVGKVVRAGYLIGAGAGEKSGESEPRMMEDNRAVSIFSVLPSGLCDFNSER